MEQCSKPWFPTLSVQVGHGHAGLGSGRQFSSKADNSQVETDWTRGAVWVRAGWGRAGDGSLLSPPQQPPHRLATAPQQDNITQLLDTDGRLDPDRLGEWLSSRRLDPNDPRNAELLAGLGPGRGRGMAGELGGAGQEGGTGGGHFRLDECGDQLSFCPASQLAASTRCQLLQLRRAGAPEFRNYRMIPALEKEIPRGIIDSYAKKIEQSRREVAGSGDPLRGRHRLQLEQTRAQVSPVHLVLSV